MAPGPTTIDVLRGMSGGHPSLVDAAAALCFVGYLLVGLGLVVSERRSGGSGRRTAVSLFLLYVLGAGFGAGLTQRDLWPFAAWPIKALIPFPDVGTQRVVAVDARGVEHNIDYRAWQPLGIDELTPWIIFRLPRLPPDAQDRAAAYLLGRAETARLRARGAAGDFEGSLGPLTAPSFLLHPRIWRGPADVPAEPFVGLRVYEETWNLRERRREPQRVGRVLVFEIPRR